jgi:hypothetical protein
MSQRAMSLGRDVNHLLNVKPAMGFTLPSAGVTPAPSANRKMARTPFCSQVLFPVSFRAKVGVAKNPGSASDSAMQFQSEPKGQSGE